MIRTLARKLPAPIKGVLKKLRRKHRIIQQAGRRRSIAMGYYSKNLELIRKWIWKDTETSNFYYKLTPLNRDYLAQTISSLTDESYEKIIQYFYELENDNGLREHLRMSLQGTHYGSDIEIEYGRRLGWYAFVRALKPRVVVETGVDHGVGACVLASALLRNSAEGFSGRYYGTDIRPEAGQLFCGRYSEAGSILYGDSIQSLEKLNEKIDLFINDSDHSEEYEYREYLTVSEKLSEKAIILGDNSHSTDSLSRFSRESHRKFLFFAEEPYNHWYPGAGIGISYK